MHRLGVNRLGDDGTGAICKALSESKVSKLQELDLTNNCIGLPGTKAIGDMLLVHASLTRCNILGNKMDVASAKLLVDAVKDKDCSLAGITPDQTTADFNSDDLEPPDAILLASDLSKAGVSASLTKIR